LSHNLIWTFYQSKNKPSELWVGTFNGLTRIDVDKKIFKSFIPDQNNPNQFSRSISSICEDASGNGEIFWIGTYGGLLKLNVNTMQFRRWVNQNDDPYGLSINLINKLWIDRSGVFWIAGQNGINYYSALRDKFAYKSGSKLGDSDINNLDGLDVQAIIRTSNPLKGGLNETIWAGTTTGLYYFYHSEKTFRLFDKHNLPGRNIWSLASGNNNLSGAETTDLWIGTYGEGLKHLDLKSGKVNHWKGNAKDSSNISNAYVKALHLDKFGYLWIGLWGAGLNRLDLKSGNIKKWRFDDNNPKSLSYDDVWIIFEDRKGRIWIGTHGGGLNLYNKSDEESFYKLIYDPDNEKSLSSNNILFIYEPLNKNKYSSQTVLLVGTENGLNKISFNDIKTGRENILETKVVRYLSNRVINGIVEDFRGHLWITTNNGLIEFDTLKGIINQYSVFDGLQSNEFNPNSIVKTENGKIYIGGINGLNFFHPDSIISSSYLPPVVLTDFQVFNQPVAVGLDSPLKTSIQTADEITLAYNQNVFSFQFASLDYNSPEMNQYAYMMEGFDEDWIYSGNRRFITYTNLDPGKYIFLVKATNSDGIWNEKGRQIAIIINPPFWATWWFRTILILLFLSIGPVIYFRRITALKKEKQLQVEFSKQLIHSQEQERKRIASELHDSLGQDLLVIKNLALMNKNKDEQFDEISKSAGLAIDEMRRISYNLHPYQLDRLGLTKAINSMFSNIEGTSKINFEITIEDIDNLFSKEQEINIFRIVQECVNNIIKHSEAAKSKVEVCKVSGNVQIEIADNGKGFNYQTVKLASEGFGLKNLENRVSFLGGEIEFSSNEKFATIVNIIIPYQTDGKN